MLGAVTCCSCFLALLGAVAATRKDDARISHLPGLMFDPGFKQYSGYLNAGHNSVANFKFFYWFTEAQVAPETAPLVLWLNGGPGCSSVGGLLEELGPFYVNADGATLFENPYSWNKLANVIFLESPQGVGFSYSTDFNESSWTNNDTHVAEQNYMALLDFFTVFPEYVGRDFYITGESYGGTYIPTLTSRVLRGIVEHEFPTNLTGIAIGNGCMDSKLLQNALIDYMYYHGFVGTDKWNQIKDSCCNHGTVFPTECNYVKHLILVNNYFYKSDGSLCGNLSIEASNNIQNLNKFDPYNVYQDCYMKHFYIKKLLMPTAMQMADGARNTNYDSTDALKGYPCFQDRASYQYLNLAAVQDALHIAADWKNHTRQWLDCVGINYTPEHESMAGVFDGILESATHAGAPTPRVLIYNGDVDTVCNYLGDAWFVDALADRNHYSVSRVATALSLPTGAAVQLYSEYQPWYFRGQIGGFVKSFNNSVDNSIDLLTVKGSGHFVPLDRPGPALQMMANFIGATRNYSRDGGVDTSLKKPLPTTPPPPGRKQRDRIDALPGLTFQLNFAQYSGYLDAGKNASNNASYHLHYWLVESQHSNKDPLLLWLNGGPGCSSMGGFLEELGPFYPNKGGDTLYENVFAWNKVANVLFLESPHGVGFSYADDWTVKNNDDMAALENINALKDFFTVFPEYTNRDFYLTGESYAGMYIPWLAVKILDGIDDGTFPNSNFKGAAIGNGFFSEPLLTNSIVNFNYYHGLVGTKLWKELQHLCCEGVHPDKCDYFSHLLHVQPVGQPDEFKSDGTACGNATFKASYMLQNFQINDPYNLYQSCYMTKTRMFFERMAPTLMRYADTAQLINRDSTDALRGLPCWGDLATFHYFNTPAVQSAIHISADWQSHVKTWHDCNGDIYNTFDTLMDDVGPQFDAILRARPNAKPIRLLVYNGDVDMVCNFLGDAWFIERVTANHSIPMTGSRDLWRYRGQVAGYVQSYGSPGQTSIDVLTVNGAGHFVPADRAGPSLQMIANFIWNTTDYSRPTGVDEQPKPLVQPLMHTTTPHPTTPRKGAANSTVASIMAVLFAMALLFWPSQ